MFFLKPKKNKRVYLDTAAATPVDKRVRRALEPYLSFQFGNPGSIHQEGVLAKQAVTQARIMVAQSLVCLPEEIIFTSGGTESNNLAIVGTALLYEKKHGQLGRLITTAIEHRSILEPAQYLKSRGWDIVILPVAPAGSLDLKKLEQEITPNTALVSLGYGNNEIGTIFPVREVAKIIRRFRKNNLTTYPLFHLDACQAPRFLPLRTAKLGVDLLTINGSKIYGPKGSGVLYKRKEIEIAAVVYGGGQESGMRSGTENVAGIVGLATALSICTKFALAESLQLSKLRDYFFTKIKKEISGVIIHGSEDNRLANNINLTLLGVDSEWAVIQLDERGFAVATGSACSSGQNDDRHVLRALYGDLAPAEGSIRITLGRDITSQDIDNLICALKEISV